MVPWVIRVPTHPEKTGVSSAEDSVSCVPYMNEEQRDEVIDLLPKDACIWDFEDETEHFSHATVSWWMEQLGHGPKSPTHNCCKACGCSTTCVAGAFHEALVSSVIREIDKLGLLRAPKGRK